MKSIAENKIEINGKFYEYIIIYKNIKNIYFRVKEDYKIYVTCNKLVSVKYIENLLKSNEKALEKMLLNIEKKVSYKEEIYYLGKKLNFVESENKPYIDGNNIYATSVLEAKDFIYKKALDVFKERLDMITPYYRGLPKFTLKARKMKSKWGVCNIRSMSITLNSELITKKVHLIDYVIIHELCHFKYMNHSPKFWEFVAKFYPNYKEARKELNH